MLVFVLLLQLALCKILHKDLGLAIILFSMNSLQVDGVKYIKASSIARDLGYTADYIGQLCRAEKVEAKLVGRSWYVSEVSLLDHKKTRYRSTKAKAKAALQQAVSNQSEQTSKRVANIRYESEEAELMPSVRQVEVVTGEEESISIAIEKPQQVKIAKTPTPTRHYRPLPRKEPIFSGSLGVQSAEADEVGETPEISETLETSPDPISTPVTVPKKTKESQRTVIPITAVPTRGTTLKVGRSKRSRLSLGSRLTSTLIALVFIFIITCFVVTVMVSARLSVFASNSSYTAEQNYRIDASGLRILMEKIRLKI